MTLIFECEHCQKVRVGYRKPSPLIPGVECICVSAHRAGVEDTRHDIAHWLRRQGVSEKIVSGVEHNEWARR